MSSDEKHNIGHSIFQRLLNLARKRGEDFNLLLLRYGVERFLYRLSISPYAENFILKGASLFIVWKGQNYRATKDTDLLGPALLDSENIAGIFRELCRPGLDRIDGIRFQPDSIRVAPIREAQEKVGLRVTFVGILHHARVYLQVDIGSGDPVTPPPKMMEFPTLLGAPPPRLLTYSRYTVVAEKLEIMLRLGIANSRMKDFYDLWLLSRLFEFSGRLLCRAVRNTLNQRATTLPTDVPMAFTPEFSQDRQKLIQWRAFIRKSKPDSVPGDLYSVIQDVGKFLMPVVKALQDEKLLQSRWAEGGPWLAK